ncbi:ABC transporter substrate-binding protein [Agromyces mangrovi Wang et al. 2018]|uniref:ABC transporter substrate-binding protein n=1 Tax=Agromyces mangrovi TaxID=1858653 RepID=UPI002573F87C|nr:extracellular solute-binding protein [Agromyces mangrovi]BDZ64430.1 ABC transporter substrate-binding protein [Agromyces mangrovi]
MTHRRVLANTLGAVTVLGLAVASLTGCGASESSADGPVTVTFAAWWPEETVAAGLELANEDLASEGVQIEYEYVEFEQYNTFLNTQIESGGGPDLTPSGNFPSLITTGALLPIEDASIYEGFNEAGLFKATDDDGQVYGIPTWGWFSAYFYNTELFQQNRVEPPTTWEELTDVNQVFLDNDITPIAFGLAQGNDRAMHSLEGYLNNSYYENGAGSAEDDVAFALGEKSLGEIWGPSVEEWSATIDQGVLTPEMLGIPEQQALEAFQTGRAAMIITGPWHYEQFKESGVPFGVFSHVGADADNRWLVGGPGEPIGVNANTEHPDAAFAALAALAQVDVQKALVDANPGSFSSFQGVTPDLPAEYELILPMLEQGNVAFPLARWDAGLNSGTVGTEVISQLQKLILGEITPEQFTDNVDKVADTARF